MSITRTFFTDALFEICDKQGQPTFVVQGGEIASMERVERLRSACESHLKAFSQSEIDIHNARFAAEYNEKARVECESPKRVPDGFVYLMRNLRNGLVKIGFSKKPSFREKTLQSEEPEIKLIHSHSASFLEEQDLHAHFSEKRIRGEWFCLSEDDIAYVRALDTKIADATTGGF